MLSVPGSRFGLITKKNCESVRQEGNSSLESTQQIHRGRELQFMKTAAELVLRRRAEAPPPQRAKTARVGDPSACPHVVRGGPRTV